MRGRDHGETFDPRIPRPDRSGRLTSNADRAQAQARQPEGAEACRLPCDSLHAVLRAGSSLCQPAGVGFSGHLWSVGCRDVKQVLGYQNSAPNDHPTFCRHAAPFQEAGARRFRHETGGTCVLFKKPSHASFHTQVGLLYDLLGIREFGYILHLSTPNKLPLNELTSPDLSGHIYSSRYLRLPSLIYFSISHTYFLQPSSPCYKPTTRAIRALSSMAQQLL